MTYTVQQIAVMTDRQLEKLLIKACDNDMHALSSRILKEMDWREECSRRNELFGFEA